MSPSESAQLAEVRELIRSDIRELRETLAEHMLKEAATSAEVGTKLDDIAKRVGTLEKRDRDELEERAEKAEGKIEKASETRAEYVGKIVLLVLTVVLTAASSLYIGHQVAKGTGTPPASAATR